MPSLIVALKPGWVHTKDSLAYSNNFASIINFYLFSTPCIHTSSSGQTMIDRGWSKDVWKTRYLRDYLLKSANLDKNTYKKVSTLAEITNEVATLKLNGTFQKKREVNRLVFYNENKEPEFLSIFFYIRCALAHGRFQIYKNAENDIIYVLEAVKRISKTDKYDVRARMVLSESTLLTWANIIKNGQNTFEEIKKIVTKEIQTQIISTIQNQSKITKKVLIESLSFEKNDIQTQIKILAEMKLIQYDMKKMTWVIRGEY